MRKMILWALAGLCCGVVLLGAQGPAWAVDGQEVYQKHCVLCHGQNGKGDGPIASNFSHHPGDFTSPAFWQGDVDKKIADAINNGKGEMIPLGLQPDDIKAVTEYIKKTFKK